VEDHLGDILRKARQAAEISNAAAASAAQFSIDELAELEITGTVVRPPDFSALSALLGLHAGKLRAVANGWTPQRPEVSGWRELRPMSTTRDGNTVNCYLVWDEVCREAALFDTGWEAAPIFKLIEENELQLKHLFLTHLHEDHVAAMGELRQSFPKLHLHTNSRSVPPQHRNRANDFIQLGSLRISNREAPGHAAEGVIYVIGNWPDDAPHVAIVGDTLFAGSIATGLQSWKMLMQNIREQILSLPDEALLCPGHGPLTTVAEEKTHNPFFP
jgi:hydroxyacylglutathione hydrolase